MRRAMRVSLLRVDGGGKRGGAGNSFIGCLFIGCGAKVRRLLGHLIEIRTEVSLEMKAKIAIFRSIMNLEASRSESGAESSEKKIPSH